MNKQDLMALAQQAAENAYAPYSRFQVGAALETSDGRIFTGCNVENASYGLGRCAEQTAIQKMVSEGAREFVQIAVFTRASPPSSPCGAPEAAVYLTNHQGELLETTVRDLLPHGFGPKDLVGF
jgi:cytidine deaminase